MKDKEGRYYIIAFLIFIINYRIISVSIIFILHNPSFFCYSWSFLKVHLQEKGTKSVTLHRSGFTRVAVCVEISSLPYMVHNMALELSET